MASVSCNSPPAPGSMRRSGVEDRTIEQIATCSGKGRRRVFHSRLLDHADDLEDVGIDRVGNDLDVEDAVSADCVFRDVDCTENGSAALGPNSRHDLQDATR